MRNAVIAPWLAAVLALLAVVAGPASGQAQGPAPVAVIDGSASADKVEAFFRGTWLVTVQGQQRTRQMVIRDAKPEGGRYILDAYYNWSDAAPTKVMATARLENGIVALELTTPTRAQIAARSTGDTSLTGTFQGDGGRPLPTTLERVSASTALRMLSNTPAPILPPNASVTAADIERLLWGTWMVTVGGAPRTRTMVVRSAQEQGGKFSVETVYGWSDGEPRPVPMTVTHENGIVSLDLMSSARTRIVARSVSTDRFLGTLTAPDGKEFPVKLMLTGDDGIPLAFTAPPPTAVRPKLQVVYIGAMNCPSCLSWNTGRGSDPSMGRYAFIDSPEGKAVEYHHLTVANFMNTRQDQDWPEALRWVREKTYVAAGTPRFILIADNKIVANTTGLSRMGNVIVPKIRELAGIKK